MSLRSENLLEKTIRLRCSAGLDVPCQTLFFTLISCKYGNIDFLVAENGAHVGYVAYAMISSNAARCMLNTGRPLHYESEWGEGHIYFIIDIVFLPGRKATTIRLLKDVLASKRVVVYKRKGRIKLWTRWKGRCSVSINRKR